MPKRTIDDIDVAGRRVLVRVDFNVPIDADRNITDDTRVKAALPTLWHLLEKGASLVLMSHLGRPRGQHRPDLTLAPVASLLHQLLGTSVHLAPDCIGTETGRMAGDLKPGQVILLENLRFHPEEEDNDPDFARQLAALGDLYVNDAFGAAHRAHASTEGVTHYFDQAVSGYLMKKELQYLQDAIADPQRPFVAILGGAKVSDKIEVVRNLMSKVDTLLIGGGMSYTFLKAKGLEIGDSLFDPESVSIAGEMLSQAESSDVELLLPVDLVVAARIAAGVDTGIVAADAIPEGLQGLDVGPESSALFEDRAGKAGTVVWNGPLGVFEVEPFAKATLSMARCLERAGWESGAVTIIGGGDTAAAVAQAGVADRMTHVSTGGGASLECLAGLELPGAAALSDA